MPRNHQTEWKRWLKKSHSVSLPTNHSSDLFVKWSQKARPYSHPLLSVEAMSLDNGNSPDEKATRNKPNQTRRNKPLSTSNNPKWKCSLVLMVAEILLAYHWILTIAHMPPVDGQRLSRQTGVITLHSHFKRSRDMVHKNTWRFKIQYSKFQETFVHRPTACKLPKQI